MTETIVPEQPRLPGSDADDGRRWVVDLEVGERVKAAFLMSRCDLRTGRNGQAYLALELCDRSGRIDGRMWEGAEMAVKRVGAGEYVWLEGTVDSWQGTPQLRVESLRPADSEQIDYADFLPASARDPREMYREALDTVAEIDNPHLRQLLETILGDDEIASRFQRAPGGMKLHHAWIGGLLEHTLSVVGLARRIAGHYEDLDGDLLIAGAFLHDLGKIWELTYEGSFGYSEEGRLMGHLVLETTWIDKAIDAQPDFPESLRAHLLHLLASHHGSHEYGAPVLPATPEALVLHYIDDLDSKMAAMAAAISEAEDQGADDAWSRSLGRRVVRRRWDDEGD